MHAQGCRRSLEASQRPVVFSSANGDKLGAMADGSDRIESRLKEERRFHPSPAFVDQAHLSSHHAYSALYSQSIEEPDVFWREQTIDFSWRTPWSTFSEWTTDARTARAKFFLGGKLNVTESCLDRHLSTARRTK